MALPGHGVVGLPATDVPKTLKPCFWRVQGGGCLLALVGWLRWATSAGNADGTGGYRPPSRRGADAALRVGVDWLRAAPRVASGDNNPVSATRGPSTWLFLGTQRDVEMIC